MIENVDMIQSDSNDSAVDSSDSTIDSAKGESKIELLSKLLERESIAKNNDGQFLPNNKQLKDLVNCIDDSTGKPISLERINTSKITSMKELFANSNRTDFRGIEKWDTSKVTSFAYAFSRAEHFDSDISKWNVSKGKSFYYMFFRALKFNQPIGESWDTSSAVNMRAMFCFAINFNNGGKPFGNKWKMDNVEISAEMFYNAKNFNAEGLNKWNMSNIRKCWSMFNGAKAFNQPLDEWDLSNNETFWGMFYDAENFNQDLNSWGNRLSKARDMSKMFADTKSLNQTFAWKLSENCDLTNITKGSALKLEISFIGDDKQETLQDSTQSNEKVSTTQSKKFARNVSSFRIYKVATIPNNLSKLKETNNKYCLYRWIPKNIKVNYEIFFAKNSENQIISATEADWEFIYYRIFGHCFAVETDNFKLPQAINKRDILTIEQRKDDEEFDEFNFDKCPKDYKNDDIEIILEDKEHIMRIYNGDTTEINSYRILNIIGALILAKAYEAKMEYFNEQARAKDTKLTECHKKICDFDLQHYQNMPVIADLSVIHFWNKLSQRYMIEAKHKELQETISRVAQLVSEENQKKFNYLMLAVAIFSALGAILAAVPVAQSLWN